MQLFPGCVMIGFEGFAAVETNASDVLLQWVVAKVKLNSLVTNVCVQAMARLWLR